MSVIYLAIPALVYQYCWMGQDSASVLGLCQEALGLCRS